MVVKRENNRKADFFKKRLVFQGLRQWVLLLRKPPSKLLTSSSSCCPPCMNLRAESLGFFSSRLHIFLFFYGFITFTSCTHLYLFLYHVLYWEQQKKKQRLGPCLVWKLTLKESTHAHKYSKPILGFLMSSLTIHFFFFFGSFCWSWIK